MSGILTVAAGVLLAAYLYRELQDYAFVRLLLFWWVAVPLMIIAVLFIFSLSAKAAGSTPPVLLIYTGEE